MGRLICLESVGSTNEYLKTEARKGAAEGTVVLANAQTEGRGRLGREFFSPPSMGIYLSMLLRPQESADVIASLTANAAVAVCKALERVCGIEPEIKWVNDILLRGKKLCGILCESAIGETGIDFVVLGIGLNVITRPEDFPPELRKTAGSVYSQTGNVPDRGKLIVAIIEELDLMYALWKRDKGAYLDEYRRRCRMLGKTVTLTSHGSAAEVKALDIAEDFGLKIETATGETGVLHWGEVSVGLN